MILLHGTCVIFRCSIQYRAEKSLENNLIDVFITCLTLTYNWCNGNIFEACDFATQVIQHRNALPPSIWPSLSLATLFLPLYPVFLFRYLALPLANSTQDKPQGCSSLSWFPLNLRWTFTRINERLTCPSPVFACSGWFVFFEFEWCDLSFSSVEIR